VTTEVRVVASKLTVATNERIMNLKRVSGPKMPLKRMTGRQLKAYQSNKEGILESCNKVGKQLHKRQVLTFKTLTDISLGPPPPRGLHLFHLQNQACLC